LSNLLKHFNIKNENSHRSIGDCKATFELFLKLIKIIK